ncbi:MAG: O-linked N-acetylglucosamine transferase, SPINDLY family protein [Cyanobacteriota bacterium]|nr:O-linked N-acetylglucosamine transferase, SPINDLY family protein [Cyanobacteriota bacterium]
MSVNSQIPIPQAELYWVQGEYTQAAALYEQAIETDPAPANYWYFGLALLLQGKEEEAQLAWMTRMLEATPEQELQWTAQLRQILETEAQRQEATSSHQIAWLVRQHIREIAPDGCNNLLRIIQLSISLETFSGENSALLQVTQLLQESRDSVEFDSDLLLETLKQVLNFSHYFCSTFDFADACIAYCQDPLIPIEILLDTAIELNRSSSSSLAIRLIEISLKFEPNHFELLWYMAAFLQDEGKSLESIPFAQRCLDIAINSVEKTAVLHLILKGLMKAGGQWKQAVEFHQNYQDAIAYLCQENFDVPIFSLRKILSVGFYAAYFNDEPQTARSLRNQLASSVQAKLRNFLREPVDRYQQKHTSVGRPIAENKGSRQGSKKLKIGYLSQCFRLHSVGWLVRWLLQYHDRSSFEIHAYSLHQTGDWLQEKFETEYCAEFHRVSYTIDSTAEQIYQDDIDVLVDLDSLTSNCGCGILALKPAPVQVSWLGFDATGIPAVDYFIADPYVLPDTARSYYTESIWRLPQTYIAVDGFEVGIPTLRRDRLGIPNDAIVYFSAQSGPKRHPDNIRLQMKILKEVPNSYFLLKGANTDLEAVKLFFEEIATEEGVSCDRLRFLPGVPSSMIHRADLRIADVVLDTYPYNGTTTTLETLWVGVPVVTRVGLQFASRQGYTLLTNVGVTEGIAYTDEEYVEWGIRFGKSADLRQRVSQKLQASRQTAPLWNTKQFAREMENAYEQMWMNYLDTAR